MINVIVINLIGLKSLYKWQKKQKKKKTPGDL